MGVEQETFINSCSTQVYKIVKLWKVLFLEKRGFSNDDLNDHFNFVFLIVV